MSGRCFLACSLIVAVPVVCSAGAMTREEVVRNYTATLAKQEKFALKFTREHVRHTQGGGTALQDIQGTTTRYMTGELITDGHRSVYRTSKWGQLFDRDRPFSKDNPYYHMYTYDGQKVLTYTRHPTYERQPHGGLMIDPNPPRRAQNVLPGYNGKFLLGYFVLGALRMDEVMADSSTRVSVRDEPETINGVDCHVLDVTSQYGRATLWLDPEHGYNVAQASSHFKGGDIHLAGTNKRFGSSYKQDNYYKAISFELVDGVWFPTKGTMEYEGSDSRSWWAYNISDTFANVKLNPDMNAALSTAEADIPDGAVGAYRGQHIPVGSSSPYVWQDGRMVPMAE